VTVHREQSVKIEKTNKMQQSDVYYELLSQHVSGIIMRLWGAALWGASTTQRPKTATNYIQQNQRSTPHAVTHVLFS